MQWNQYVWGKFIPCLFRRWLTITYLPLLYHMQEGKLTLTLTLTQHRSLPVSHAGRKVNPNTNPNTAQISSSITCRKESLVTWKAATRMCRMLTVSYEPSSLNVVLWLYGNAGLLDLQKRDHWLPLLLDSAQWLHKSTCCQYSSRFMS